MNRPPLMSSARCSWLLGVASITFPKTLCRGFLAAREECSGITTGRAATWQALDRLKSSAPRAVFSVELPNTVLARALASLSERDREALLLTAWEGLTTDQAAAVLGCSPQAFRVRAHRARQRLMDAMRALDQADEAPSIAEVCK